MDGVPGHDEPVDIAVQHQRFALAQPAVPDLVAFHHDAGHRRGRTAVKGDAVGVAVGVLNVVDEIVAELNEARASFHADSHRRATAEEVLYCHSNDSDVISAADRDALSGHPRAVQNGARVTQQGDESGG